MHVSEVGQHGVDDERHGQAHYGRHETAEDQQVFPAALDIGRRDLFRDVARVAREHRTVAVVGQKVFQAVFVIRHAPAVSRQKDRAVGQQFEIAVLVDVPFLALKPAEVVQQQGLVGRFPAVVGRLVDRGVQCPPFKFLALVAVCKRR